MPRRLDARDTAFATAFAELVDDRREATVDVSAAVTAILADVRARGDAALLDYTARFDRVNVDTVAALRVMPD